MAVRIVAFVLLLAAPDSRGISRGVDLLRLIDPARDAVAGKWEWKDGALLAPALQFGRLQVPYVPPEEYELRAVVERTTGSDSIQLGLAMGRTQFLVIVDGIETDPSSGLDLVDRKPFYANDTTLKARLVKNDVPCEIRVSVRKERVVTWVDGRKIIDWKADYGRLSLWPSWTMPRRDTLFLGAWTGARRFRALSLTPLKGEGRGIR